MKESRKQRRPWRRLVTAKRYRFLLPPDVPMPSLRVDLECWDRIVDGLPNGYTLPDDLFLKWMETRVKAESGGGDG